MLLFWQWCLEYDGGDPAYAENGASGQSLADTRRCMSEGSADTCKTCHTDKLHSKQHPSYLPVDVSAAGIAEIVMAGDLGPNSRLYHIVNPDNSTSFDEIYDYMEAAGVKGFERLERREWLKRLEASPSDPAVNPSYKLLDFFRKRFAGEKLNPQIKFEVTETSKVAPSIASCAPITKDLVAKWVASWRDVGFFE